MFYHSENVAEESGQLSVISQEYNCLDQWAVLMQMKRKDDSNNYTYGFMDALDYKTFMEK